MTRLYIPLMILQAYCLHHAYHNRANSIWYFLILFVPILGSVVYLYKFFYSRDKVDTITESVKETFDSTYKKKNLVKNFNHSDTMQNKTKLAEELFYEGDFETSIALYESCLKNNTSDSELLKKLVLLHYYNKEYDKAIFYGDQLVDDTFFKNDEERIALAWSYYEVGKSESAEEVFMDMNRVFSNYTHRLEYVKFLKLTDNNSVAKSLLEEMMSEFERMQKDSRRQKKHFLTTINQEYSVYR